jgi:hypothetical protein
MLTIVHGFKESDESDVAVILKDTDDDVFGIANTMAGVGYEFVTCAELTPHEAADVDTSMVGKLLDEGTLRSKFGAWLYPDDVDEEFSD